MTRSMLRQRLLLTLLSTLGCAVAETDEPDSTKLEPSAGGAGTSSGGKAGSAAGSGAKAGAHQGGTRPIPAGAAGSEDAGSSGTGGSAGSSAGGKSQAGSGGASAGMGGTGPDPGTVLFMDDFESGDAASWQANTTGDWVVALDGQNHVYRQPTTTDLLHISWVTGTWQDVALEAKVKVLSFGGTADQDIVCLYARVADDRNHYSAAIRPNGRVAIRKRVDGQNTTIGSSEDAGIVLGTWYTVKLEVSGTMLKAYVDGALINTQTDATLSAGGIGLGGDNSSAEFDDVVVTAL